MINFETNLPKIAHKKKQKNMYASNVYFFYPKSHENALQTAKEVQDYLSILNQVQEKYKQIRKNMYSTSLNSPKLWKIDVGKSAKARDTKKKS
jgi:hypothetical protein